MVVDPFTYADLFCGAGGLSLGFRNAGFRELFAADQWTDAITTYRDNLFAGAEVLEIAEQLELPEVDVIVGGPPCQGFSSAGLRRSGDQRNSLVSVFARLVAEHTPRAFVFENVEGFLTAEAGSRIFDLLDPVIERGYRVHLRKVNAANYGVPQHRKRVIVIGGLGWDPPFPDPTSFAFGAPGAESIGLDLPRTPTVAEALAGLPAPAESAPGDPQGHVALRFGPGDAERVPLLRPGMTMRDLPEDLQHPSYRRRANRRVMDGTPTERRGGAPAGLRRLVPDEPSKTITGGAKSEFVHPTEDRPLTIRECARLQTFPDDFTFAGSTSTQVQLIGNAVPPRLGQAVAETLAEGLRRVPATEKEGRLLTFTPTASNGRSPALQRVTDLVLERYGTMTPQPEQQELWV